MDCIGAASVIFFSTIFRGLLSLRSAEFHHLGFVQFLWATRCSTALPWGLHRFYDKHAPVKTLRVRHTARPKWFTTPVQDAIHCCDHILEKETTRWVQKQRDKFTSVLIVQELCESRVGRPGLSVLTSLLVSVDVKLYWTMLRHWSQLVPNMSTDIWGH